MLAAGRMPSRRVCTRRCNTVQGDRAWGVVHGVGGCVTSTALAVVHRGVCHDEPPGSQGMTGGIRVRCGLGAVEEYEASSMGSVRWKRLLRVCGFAGFIPAHLPGPLL